MLTGLALLALFVWFVCAHDSYKMYGSPKYIWELILVGVLFAGVTWFGIHATNNFITVQPTEKHALVAFSDGNAIHYAEVNKIRNFVMNLDNGEIVTLPGNSTDPNIKIEWFKQVDKPTLVIDKRSYSTSSILLGFSWRDNIKYKIYYSGDISS